MQRDDKILTHPGLVPLWESMERNRRQQQTAALVLMALGLGSVVGGILLQKSWSPLVGGVIATLALYWFYRVLTRQPIAYWRRQLRNNPDSIIWVYGMVTERMPFGFRIGAMATLHLVDKERQMHCFSLRPQELKLVTKTLNRVLPNAAFGYTPERELEFCGEVTDFRDRTTAAWEELEKKK